MLKNMQTISGWQKHRPLPDRARGQLETILDLEIDL